MPDKNQFSVYELGIIKNSLRDRKVNIEEYRVDLVTNDDDEEMNNNIDGFSSELTDIEDKIRLMIDNKITEKSKA